MKNILGKTLVTVLIVCVVCKRANSTEVDLSIGSLETEEQLVENVLVDAAHPNFKWLKTVKDRVIHVGNSSGTIVYLTSKGLGIFVTALHVSKDLEVRFRGGASEDLKESLGFPNELKPLNDIDAAFQSTRTLLLNGLPSRNVAYSFYTPSVPAAVAQDSSTISAYQDIVLGMITGKIIAATNLSIADIDKTPIAQELTSSIPESAQVIAEARESEKVILVGFPGKNGNKLSYSIGKVISANDAFVKIKNSTDSTERDTPYLPDAEFVVDTRASRGFSGGAAFDKYGRYLGILYRGEDSNSNRFVRVIKASFIFGNKLPNAIKFLNEEKRVEISNILELEKRIFDFRKSMLSTSCLNFY